MLGASQAIGVSIFKGDKGTKMVENLMITENEVVECVASYLKSIGFSIEKTCNTMQKGIDIIAQKDSTKLVIEAKGATTSKDTKRKGKTFSMNQVKNHVAKAILKALQMKEHGDAEIVAIALPYNKNHLKIMKTVEKTLNSLEIITIWCDGVSVEICGENKLLK